MKEKRAHLFGINRETESSFSPPREEKRKEKKRIHKRINKGKKI